MTRDELQRCVNQFKWFHILDLGQGVVTPGVIDPTGNEHGARFHVPDNLDGKTVLDIGAWDGAWSFEAKRRKATRVLATDSYSWGGGGWGNKGAFELARAALDLDVEDETIDVLDLSSERIGKFDVVFFFGVIYHMRHPMLALDRLREVTAPGGLAIVESMAAMTKSKEPVLAFYPTNECGGDASNWFGPNPAALCAMLRASGFTEVTLVSKPDRWRPCTRADHLWSLNVTGDLADEFGPDFPCQQHGKNCVARKARLQRDRIAAQAVLLGRALAAGHFHIRAAPDNQAKSSSSQSPLTPRVRYRAPEPWRLVVVERGPLKPKLAGGWDVLFLDAAQLRVPHVLRVNCHMLVTVCYFHLRR